MSMTVVMTASYPLPLPPSWPGLPRLRRACYAGAPFDGGDVELRQKAQSLRERNKAAKLAKISRVARRFFIRRGYDDTTLRAIAAQAGVGLGTLFSYASDKRDLLFLIINDDIEAM